MAGSICEPLCIRKEIKFRNCLGHGVKLHVLETEWNGDTVVLKTPRPLGTNLAVKMTDVLIPRSTKKEDFTMSTEEFISHVSESMHNYGNFIFMIIIMVTVQVLLTLLEAPGPPMQITEPPPHTLS